MFQKNVTDLRVSFNDLILIRKKSIQKRHREFRPYHNYNTSVV